MKNEIFTVVDGVDISLTNINGKTIELSRMFLSIDLYESIFDFFLSGKLVIVDTLDLMSNFIIIGNETLNFGIRTTDTDKQIDFNFRIYKVNPDVDDHRGDRKRRIIEFYFCSEEALTNDKISISKKFSDKPETIIQDVLTNYLSSTKTLDSEATTDIVDVYSNYWKANRLINFISKISKNSNYFDYIFFETFDGFTFKSLSGLLMEESVQNVDFSTHTESFIGNTIKIHKFEKVFDIVQSLKSGLFGTTFYKPHETNYSYLKESATLDENYDTIASNGSSKHFDVALSDTNNMVNTNFYEPDISKVRLASLKLLDSYNFVIRMNGNFDRKCGDNLNIEFPNFDNESATSDSFTGNWLITSIRHTILQNNTYRQNISLSKNAFFNNQNLPSISTLVKA